MLLLDAFRSHLPRMRGNANPALALFLILGRRRWRRCHGGVPAAGRRTDARLFEIIAVAYAIFRVLALLACWPRRRARITGCWPSTRGRPRPGVLQGCFVLALIVNAIVTWRGRGPATAASTLTLLASVLVLAGIAARRPAAGGSPSMAPHRAHGRSLGHGLGAATTGMPSATDLVTPALTNRRCCRRSGCS